MTAFSMDNRFKSERGFALVLTMSMLIILSVLGILVLDATNTDLAITSNYRSSSDAFSAAERAVEYATNEDILFSTEDTHLAWFEDGTFKSGETVAGFDIEDRWGHLQDTVNGTELVRSADPDVNVVKNLGAGELPVRLRSKFGNEFAGYYYCVNIATQGRKQSRAAIETQKVRIFKKSDNSLTTTSDINSGGI